MCVALAFAKAVLSICSAPHLCFPAGAVGLGQSYPPQGCLLGNQNHILRRSCNVRKRLLSALLALCMVLPIMPATAAYAASATTVPSGYTAIYTASDLDAVRNNLSGNYILMNDIDLSSFGNWKPIGNAYNYFSGIFDGNGYSIYNMTITSVDQGAGLFGYVHNAEIKNIANLTGNISLSTWSTQIIGSIVADTGAHTTISRCSSSVKIICNMRFSDNTNFRSDSLYVGGIAGISGNSVIESCSFLGSISVDATDLSTSSGGIVGGLSSETNKGLDQIENCYNAGGYIYKIKKCMGRWDSWEISPKH